MSLLPYLTPCTQWSVAVNAMGDKNEQPVGACHVVGLRICAVMVPSSRGGRAGYARAAVSRAALAALAEADLTDVVAALFIRNIVAGRIEHQTAKTGIHALGSRVEPDLDEIVWEKVVEPERVHVSRSVEKQIRNRGLGGRNFPWPGLPPLTTIAFAELCALAVLSVTICMQKEDGTPVFK